MAVAPPDQAIASAPRSGPQYQLYRHFRRLLLDCDQYRDAEEMAVRIIETLLKSTSEQPLLEGGRVYRRVADGLELVAKFGAAGDTPIGALVPVDSEAVQRILGRGYFALDELDLVDQQGIPIGHPPFAALAIGQDKSVVVGLALPGHFKAADVEPAVATLHSISEACWQRQTLSDVLEQAAQVQTSLLANAVTEIPGFELASRLRPADIVGGDLLDITPLAAGTHAIAIGDATGHGLSAALLARDAVTGLRMGLQQQLKATSTLERLDRVLARSGPSSRFVSLAYLELDPRGNLISVNAGHPAPLVISPSGRTTRELASTGPVLGLPFSSSPSFHREFDRLGADEILMALTDGIFEATNPSGDELGLEPVLRTVFDNASEPLEVIIEQVFSTVDEHSDGMRQIDDQTLVTLRRA